MTNQYFMGLILLIPKYPRKINHYQPGFHDMVFTFLFFNRDSIQETCSLPSQVSVACPAKPMSKGGELTAADSSSIGVGLAFSFGSCGYTICYLMKIENLGSCSENSTLLQITRKKMAAALFQRPVLSLPQVLGQFWVP